MKLLEDNRKKSVIREIVRDIINVFKIEDDGEFYLPNYFDNEVDFYFFKKINSYLVVDLIINKNETIETFILNAEYLHDDDIINVVIEYNPNMKKQILYGLVGELNELIAHEIRHVDQNMKGTYEFDDYEPEDPYEYYTQPKELDAQLFGFKRLAKITKKPLERVVKDWFKKHKEIHRLNDKQSQDVINKILRFKSYNNFI